MKIIIQQQTFVQTISKFKILIIPS